MTTWLRGALPRPFVLFVLVVSALALMLVAACSSGSASNNPSNNPNSNPNTSQNTPRVVQERRSDLGSDAYQIVEVTNPAARGEVAEVKAKVPPETTCSLRVRSPIGTNLKADGIGEATADADGNLAWQFEIAENAIQGTATAFVECPGQMVSKTFRIS